VPNLFNLNLVNAFYDFGEIITFPVIVMSNSATRRYYHRDVQLRHPTTEFHDTIFCVRLTKYQSRGSHLIYVIFKFFIFINQMLTSH